MPENTLTVFGNPASVWGCEPASISNLNPTSFSSGLERGGQGKGQTEFQTDSLEMKCDMEVIPDSQRTTFLQSVRFVFGSAGRGAQTVARMIEFLGTPFFRSSSLSLPNLDWLGGILMDGRGGHAQMP